MGLGTEKSSYNTNKNLRILDIQGRAKNKWARTGAHKDRMKESQACTRERDLNEKVACSTKYWVRPLCGVMIKETSETLRVSWMLSGIFAYRCISLCHWRLACLQQSIFLFYTYKNFWQNFDHTNHNHRRNKVGFKEIREKTRLYFNSTGSSSGDQIDIINISNSNVKINRPPLVSYLLATSTV